MSRGLLTALLVSIALAVCLSLLPGQALDRLGGDAFGVDAKRDVPVMKMDGIVDQLNTLSLHGHLQKVTFANETLTVWLAVPATAVKQNRTWNDIYQIAHRFLTGSSAYKQVEVCVVSSEQPTDVQFSVLADRSNMANGPAVNSPAVPKFVQQNLNVNDQQVQ